MKEKNKDMIKALGTGMVLGGIITGGGVYASTVGASNVSYSNASSGLSATTAQQAIDELYKKADNQYFDLATAETNSTGKIFASKKGICIGSSRKVYCFKSNNYSVEKDRIKEAFPYCKYGSDYIDCYQSNTYSGVSCGANSGGIVGCFAGSEISGGCSVFSGNIACN